MVTKEELTAPLANNIRRIARFVDKEDPGRLFIKSIIDREQDPDIKKILEKCCSFLWETADPIKEAKSFLNELDQSTITDEKKQKIEQLFDETTEGIISLQADANELQGDASKLHLSEAEAKARDEVEVASDMGIKAMLQEEGAAWTELQKQHEKILGQLDVEAASDMGIKAMLQEEGAAWTELQKQHEKILGQLDVEAASDTGIKAMLQEEGAAWTELQKQHEKILGQLDVEVASDMGIKAMLQEEGAAWTELQKQHEKILGQLDVEAASDTGIKAMLQEEGAAWTELQKQHEKILGQLDVEVASDMGIKAMLQEEGAAWTELQKQHEKILGQLDVEAASDTGIKAMLQEEGAAWTELQKQHEKILGQLDVEAASDTGIKAMLQEEGAAWTELQKQHEKILGQLDVEAASDTGIKAMLQEEGAAWTELQKQHEKILGQLDVEVASDMGIKAMLQEEGAAWTELQKQHEKILGQLDVEAASDTGIKAMLQEEGAAWTELQKQHEKILGQLDVEVASDMGIKAMLQEEGAAWTELQKQHEKILGQLDVEAASDMGIKAMLQEEGAAWTELQKQHEKILGQLDVEVASDMGIKAMLQEEGAAWTELQKQHEKILGQLDVEAASDTGIKAMLQEEGAAWIELQKQHEKILGQLDVEAASELQQKIKTLKYGKQQLKIQIKSLQQTPIKSTEQIEEEMNLKAKLKNLRTLGHLYKIQLGASNGHLKSVRFKVKTTTDSEGRQTFVNQSEIEFIQEYLKQLEAKSWSDANYAIIKQEIINAKLALAQYVPGKSSYLPSKPKIAGELEVAGVQPDSTVTVTAANAEDNPGPTPIVSSIPTSTKSGDQDYSFYLQQISDKTVKAKTKKESKTLQFGGLEKRVTSNDKRKGNLRRLMGMIEKSRAEADGLSTIIKNNVHDEVYELDEKQDIITPRNNDQTQTKQLKLKKLKIKSHIYDDTEITNQGNEKLKVTINDPKDQEIKDTTAPHTNTYEVSKTNDKDFTMTTNDPLDTIGDKMLVQWIETFKRTEGPNKIMVISDLFRDGQSLEEKTKAQEIANKIKQYCSSAGVTLKINSEPEPENTAAFSHSPGRR